jgi:hypothetical protein
MIQVNYGARQWGLLLVLHVIAGLGSAPTAFGQMGADLHKDEDAPTTEVVVGEDEQGLKKSLYHRVRRREGLGPPGFG